MICDKFCATLLRLLRVIILFTGFSTIGAIVYAANIAPSSFGWPHAIGLITVCGSIIVALISTRAANRAEYVRKDVFNEYRLAQSERLDNIEDTTNRTLELIEKWYTDTKHN